MENNKYVIQLDGLRFFAVLMVMIAHWLQWQWTNPLVTNFPFVHGVTLFFVLSGFLITRILLSNKDEAESRNTTKTYLLKNFYIRRFLRIFPIYYLLIAFLYFIDYNNTREIFPWLVTYTSNIYQSIENVYVGDFNHFWSLAVEEQFYMFWPFLILFIKPKRIFEAIVITILLAISTKLYLFMYVDKWMATSYFTLACMHALGLGALLSYITLYKKSFAEKLSNPIWLYILGVVYLGLLYMQSELQLAWYKEVVDEIIFAFLSALIILRASNNGFKFGMKYVLESKFVSYAGKISYGLYVYHLFMPSLFYYIAPTIGINISNKYTTFVAFYFLTFLVAHFSWILIEKPISKLKHKVPYLK